MINWHFGRGLRLGVLMIVLTGCAIPKPEFMITTPTLPLGANTPTPNIFEINQVARLIMPASAKDIEAQVNTDGIDAAVFMHFTLPEKDLASFLKAAGYTSPLKEGNFVLADRSHDPAWPKEKDYVPTKKRFWGLEIVEPGFARRILVEEVDADTRRIYIEHFEW